jgi:hypothetical protein
MCHGNCSRNGSRRGIFLRNSLSVTSMSSTPCDKAVTQCLSASPILELFWYAPHPIAQKLKVKEFEFGLFSFYLRYHDYWIEKGVFECEEPHYQHYILDEGLWSFGSAGPTIVGNLGKDHRINATMNNF